MSPVTPKWGKYRMCPNIITLNQAKDTECNYFTLPLHDETCHLLRQNGVNMG